MLGILGSTDILFILALLIMPLLIIVRSKRADGTAKFGWILSALLLSWFGVAIYYFVYRNKKQVVNSYRYY